MDIGNGSRPTWWGAFDPYGAEIDTNTTTNNFKFSGMERDAQTGEAGLDNFGARAYSSNLVGKFTQPDPAGLAKANLSKRQSFYLSMAMPLRHEHELTSQFTHKWSPPGDLRCGLPVYHPL
jgi:RHS repeat-associated protein